MKGLIPIKFITITLVLIVLSGTSWLWLPSVFSFITVNAQSIQLWSSVVQWGLWILSFLSIIFNVKLYSENKQNSTGAVIKDAKSRKGNIRANDETGIGATIERVDAERDISATSINPKELTDPKD